MISLVVLLVVSCSKDNNECKCELEVSIDGSSSYFVQNVPTDCDGGFERPPQVPQNHFMLGLRNCD